MNTSKTYNYSHQQQLVSIPNQYVLEKVGEEIIEVYDIPPFTKKEIYAEVISGILFLTSWIYFASKYDDLPQKEELSLELDESEDKSNNRKVILVYPLIHTFLFIILTLMELHPNRFRYPLKISQTNYIQLFQTGRQLIIALKLCTNILFIYLTIGMIHVALEDMADEYMLFSILFFSFYAIPIYLFKIKCDELKKQQLQTFENQQKYQIKDTQEHNQNLNNNHNSQINNINNNYTTPRQQQQQRLSLEQNGKELQQNILTQYHSPEQQKFHSTKEIENQQIFKARQSTLDHGKENQQPGDIQTEQVHRNSIANRVSVKQTKDNNLLLSSQNQNQNNGNNTIQQYQKQLKSSQEKLIQPPKISLQKTESQDRILGSKDFNKL